MSKKLSAQYSRKKTKKTKKGFKNKLVKAISRSFWRRRKKQQYGHKQCKSLWEDENKRLIVYRESIIKHEKIKMLTNEDLLMFCEHKK